MEGLSLGQAVRRARMERGLSLVEVAREVGVHPSYIGKIEGDILGNRGPSIQVIIRLGRALDLDGKYLLKLAGRDREALLGMLLRRVQELEAEVNQLRNRYS